jgi:hypothetical protein
LKPLLHTQSPPSRTKESTRYQALPGKADPEALPPIFMKTIRDKSEAEPLDIGSQALPGNQLKKTRSPSGET